MENKNNKSYSRQLSDFENSIILNKCESIDFDSEYSLYDHIIKAFSNGELDVIYNSSVFNDLSVDEKSNLLKDGRRYFDLCFAKGGIDNWSEYCSNKFNGDSSLCVMSVLKNFDSLLTILRYGGEDALRMLMSFVDSSSDESIFDTLAVYFPNKEIFEQAMIELGQSDTNYSCYSNKYKKLLCEYADGVLYKKEGNDYSFRSALSVGLDIRRIITGEDDFDTFNFDDYRKLISDESLFVEALSTLSLENNMLDDIRINIK